MSRHLHLSTLDLAAERMASGGLQGLDTVRFCIPEDLHTWVVLAITSGHMGGRTLPLPARPHQRSQWAPMLWHATALISLAFGAGLQPCSAQAVPYPGQLLQAAATSCQFGLYATGSSGAIMLAHEAFAESTYTTLSLEYQQPIVNAVMQAIACASESVDGFLKPFKTTLIDGEAFPTQFFIPKLGDLPFAGVPKSDHFQLHTRGTLKGLPFKLYSRFTTMFCLNGTHSSAACQHRTALVCGDASQFANLGSWNQSDLLQQPGGCYKLAMEWSVPTGPTGTKTDSAWTNVMPHEVWKGLVANTTPGVELINQAVTETVTPSDHIRTLISDNPLLSRIPPCDSRRVYLARTQAMANLQAFQAVTASPHVSAGFADGSAWQLLQLPTPDELQNALALRACQYINATKSLLQEACPLAAGVLKGLVDASPVPTGRFCFFKSSLTDSNVVQVAALRTAQIMVGVEAEGDLASALVTLQSTATVQYPATSFTTLLLAVSSAGISVVTCEKEHVKRGIERLTQHAIKVASKCISAGSVKILRLMPSIVAYTIYLGVALGIATPAVAIIVTNLQYTKASFTSTVHANSAHVNTVPQLEVTLTETTKLLYKPHNLLISVLVGMTLCILVLFWGLSQAMKASKALRLGEGNTDEDVLSDRSDSGKLRIWSLPEGAQLRQACRGRVREDVI